MAATTSSAAQCKAAGNEAFKAKDYSAAISHYTDGASAAAAAGECADLAILFSNRCMARMKLVAEDGAQLEAALEDARQGARADPKYAKAHFREAQCLLLLKREAEALPALHRTWTCAEGDTATRELLMKHDASFAQYCTNFERVRGNMEKNREQLKAMVSKGHPMTLRVAYYATWMKRWEPEDRETALSQAFTQVVEQLKQDLRASARRIAVEQKEAGKVDFGEDGMGVKKYMNEVECELHNDAFGLVQLVTEDLVCQESYHNGEIYCQCVESVADGRDDEERFLPPSRIKAIGKMRPKSVLFGEQQLAGHKLKAWMCREMGLLMRKQILIGICLKVCMCAAGLRSLQATATQELRNQRRAAKELPPLKLGEDSEDDEIMSKSDYDIYKERQCLSAGESLNLVRQKPKEGQETGSDAPYEPGKVV